jgi:hypothetical protein
MTKIVVLVQPEGAPEQIKRLSPSQRLSLRRALRPLEELAGGREIAVLASSDSEYCYARLVAGHFFTSVSVCDGLRRGSEELEDDSVKFIDDYTDPKFGLIFVVVERTIAERLAGLIAKRTGREKRSIHEGNHIKMYLV